jgi:hypothetical protein
MYAQYAVDDNSRKTFVKDYVVEVTIEVTIEEVAPCWATSAD